LHFFLQDIVVVFVVSVVLVIEIGTLQVVTKAFVMAYAIVEVSVSVLEVGTAARNHCEFSGNRGDRYVAGSNGFGPKVRRCLLKD